MIFKYVGLPALLGRLEMAAVTTVNEGANHLVAEAQSEAPNREGTLAASIHTDGAKMTGTGVAAVVMTGAEASDYAVPQHEGAGPHIIEAKNAKALHFNGIFAKRVLHPGNPATKYIEGPLLAFAPEFLARARANMRRVF